MTIGQKSVGVNIRIAGSAHADLVFVVKTGSPDVYLVPVARVVPVAPRGICQDIKAACRKHMGKYHPTRWYPSGLNSGHSRADSQACQNEAYDAAQLERG